MINIFICTCPNRSEVGAIDNADRFEQAFVQYYIPEDPENFFTHDISMVRRQKMSIFDVLKTFISKIAYYTLYQVAQNRVKVATDGNIFEDKTFFEVPLKNFLLTS